MTTSSFEVKCVSFSLKINVSSHNAFKVPLAALNTNNSLWIDNPKALKSYLKSELASISST